MTDDKTSGSSSSRPRSRRAPVTIDQKPLSANVEQNPEVIASAEETTPDSVDTPDKPLDETFETSEGVSAVNDPVSQHETAPSNSRGIGALVLAVIAGGIAGAAVNGLMPTVFPPENDLNTRLTTVERSLATVPRTTDMDAIVQPLDDLRRQNSALGGRLSALEEQALSTATAPESPQGQAVSGEGANGLASLQERIDRIDEQLRTVEQTIAADDTTQIQSEQEAIARRLTDLEANVRARLGAFDPAHVASQIDTQATELSRLGTRLTAAEGELLSVERKALAAEASNSERLVIVARIAVLERLRDALAQGRPFVTELETLTKLGVPGASLSALQAAANGVAPAKELAGPLAQAAAGIEADPVPADAPFIDKLAAGAAGFVRIRRVDRAPDATDIAAQAVNYLEANNAQAALSTWERLPQSRRDETKALADTLQMRVNAEKELATLLQSQIQALGATAPAGTSKGE